jgi:hypothetical protein
MKPILKKQNPMEGIEIVEVFLPQPDEEHAMIYPVRIDGVTHYFFHNENAFWQVAKPSDLKKEVIYQIGHMIDQAHL